MGFYLPPWENNVEPNQANIRSWMDNLYSKFMPIEQARWNQSNIDTLFYAGNQSFINRSFQFTPGISPQQYYFNLVQQPVNMVTGRQRQHRKSTIYEAADGADPLTCDQYTRLMMNVYQRQGIHEDFSKSCELSAVAGINLMQPYLDFTGDDPAQGDLKVKIWEYNSFLIDPYARNWDLSDCQFVWCQEYISKQVAEDRFPGKTAQIRPMAGTPQRYGNFYFLPENYNMARNDLMVLSYIWYKWKKKRKRLYSKSRNQFFDFGGGEDNMRLLTEQIPDLQPVTTEGPCWRVAIVLNDQMMWQGDNPLWDGPECPFIFNAWNYDPHINQFDLRSRSLVFTMRSAQFLYNYKVISNNDIAAATINMGWKRKIGAVANEDNLKRQGQGWDIIINEGYELTDVEKLIPSAVPESDLALAEEMRKLIFGTAGIDLENWSGQSDKQISSLTMLLKQDANLMVFQKYFDQWDLSQKLLGERCLQIVLQNWNAAKVQTIIGEDPSPHFYSRVFAKYKTVVEPGLLTPTQRNLQAQQMLDINQVFGREVFPPSRIVPILNITGKGELVPWLQQQEEQMSVVQSETSNMQHAFERARLQELMTRAANNIAMAKERASRADSNVGLLEERLSEISKNQALSTKAKMDALEQLVNVASQFGELETRLKMHDIQTLSMQEDAKEDQERVKAKANSSGNEFLQQLLGNQQVGMPGQRETALV